MNIIADILKMKPKEYSLMVFDFYTFWCELNANNPEQLQSMLSNQLLYNWFIRQYECLELAFYDRVGDLKLSTLSLQQRSDIYKEICSSIGEYYPPRNLLRKVTTTGLQDAENLIQTNQN